MTQKLKSVLGTVENIVGKGENAGYQHFLLSPQCFLKNSFPNVLKVGIVWKWVEVVIIHSPLEILPKKRTMQATIFLLSPRYHLLLPRFEDNPHHFDFL